MSWTTAVEGDWVGATGVTFSRVLGGRVSRRGIQASMFRCAFALRFADNESSDARGLGAVENEPWVRGCASGRKRARILHLKTF